jgi:hypothetical protein
VIKTRERAGFLTVLHCIREPKQSTVENLS